MTLLSLNWEETVLDNPKNNRAVINYKGEF